MNDDNQPTSIDDQFLAAMGLEGLEGEEKQAALDDVLTTLNMQIGMRVAETLSDEQAAEFERLSDDASPEEIAQWLNQNISNYPQLVEEEARKMRDEVQASVSRAVEGL